jgi:large subunit ribosomal protein L29
MKDLRAMRPEELDKKLNTLEDELMHERGVAAMGGAPPSPGKLRALRTDVARIRTVMREVEIKAAKEGGMGREEKA